MKNLSVLWLLASLASLYSTVNMEAAPVTNDFDARAYLQRFNHMGQGNMQTGELPTEDDYVAALKSFQGMANITITGEFDNDTKMMMNMPRCGMPDHMGFSNAVRRKRYSALDTWPVTDLSWRINSFTDDLQNADIRRIMKDALEAWSKVSTLTFSESSAPDADIIIDFVENSHGDGSPFDGRGRVLAHAYFPSSRYGGDAHFDDAETFTQLVNTGIDLYQVAAHEFGHSLGLGHSEVTDALMAPFYRGYIPDFQLHEDDIAGIQFLYGVNSGRPDMTMEPFIPPVTTAACPSRLDTIVRTANRRTFAFIGNLVYQITVNGVVDGYPLPISEVFGDLPDDLDAGFFFPGNGKTYFFKGGQYYRYSRTTLDAGYPRSISNLRGLPNDIDAAFVWSGNGRLYFTKGDQYYRFNTFYGRVDNGYPRPLSLWNLGVDSLDAALQWDNGATYFFSGDDYYRLNDLTLSVPDSYPRPTAYWWFGCDTNNLQDVYTTMTTDPTGTSLPVAIPSIFALVLSATFALMY